MKASLAMSMAALACAVVGQTPRAGGRPELIRAGLIGSRHDFAPASSPLIDHCIACHPRSATEATGWAGAADSSTSAVTQSPSAPASQLVARYGAVDRKRDAMQGRGPHRSTVLCLGCHDGTVAASITAEPMGRIIIAPRSRIDVRHDHPVGVVYPRVDRGYRARAQVERKGIQLPGGRVECVSCHDPHNLWGQPAMLVGSNRRSALCLSCHLK